MLLISQFVTDQICSHVTDLLSFVSLAFLCNPADFLPDYLFHLQCYIWAECFKCFYDTDDVHLWRTTLGSDRASSKGYIVRWVEAPSNKLLTTAFEASLESVTVTRRLSVDSKIAGIAMEHRNPKVSEGRHRGQGGRQYMHLSLWWDFACLCGVVETIHVIQGLYVNWRGPAFSFQSV